MLVRFGSTGMAPRDRRPLGMPCRQAWQVKTTTKTSNSFSVLFVGPGKKQASATESHGSRGVVGSATRGTIISEIHV